MVSNFFRGSKLLGAIKDNFNEVFIKNNFRVTKNNIFYYFSYLSYLVVLLGLIGIKSATITEKGQISISKTLRGKKGFEEGSKIAILNYDDHIEIRSMDEIEEKFGTAFASEKSLGKIWNLKEEDKRWKKL
jgi:AbrB family looped-hinge helix DNA binding protein